jgi:hypothetical protein
VGNHLAGPADLVAFTQICTLERPAEAVYRVARALRLPSGTALGTLDPAAVTLEKRAGVWCGSLVDILPAAALRHGGDYVFEARSEDDPTGSPVTARFSVERP